MKNVVVRKAGGALGAFIEGVDLSALSTSADAIGQLRQWVIEHQVVFLRDQSLSAAQFQQVAEQFGNTMDHPAYGAPQGAPAVQVLQSTAEAPSKIEMWHSDMTFSQRPPSFTLLHAQIVPAYGGDTLWSSAVAAYDHLSAPLKACLEPLLAEHDFSYGFKESLAEPGGAERLADMVAAHPPICHPLIRTHPETQRKGIYVNPLFTTRIEGLSKLESSALLGFLYEHMRTPEFTVRLAWQPGTLAIWDNRSTQHKPVNDYFPQHRLMHRVTIAGDKPV
ncbi:MAG: TauD/TfdA dioxygenase family protein [bacterium]